MRCNSQQRTAAAQAAGRFDEEIVPVTTDDDGQGQGDRRSLAYGSHDRQGRRQPRRHDARRPRRASTPCSGPRRRSPPATPASCPTAARPAIMMEAGERRTARHWSRWAATSEWRSPGTEPDEMGIGPIDAVRSCSSASTSKVDDIGLWELNEAFAVQVLYCADKLGIPDDRLNVDGGSISIGHPYGMSGARHDRPRPDRGQAPRREACRRHHVRRRRHGRGGPVRGAC